MNKNLERKTLRMRIKSLYSSFSEKEKKIADFIINHPEKIVHGTINQVALTLDIADSTVFRFCKRLGYKGFQDMKIAIASEGSESMEQIHEKVRKNDGEKKIIEKIFNSNIQTLKDTLEIIDDEAFGMAVNKIITSDHIEFFGVGGSNAIAMDAYHKFIRTGLAVNYQVDSHLQLMSATQLKEGDLAIIISHTGQSKDILHVLETVKEKKVYTIGITGSIDSKFNREVDISLNTLSEETDFRSEALSSRIGQLTILDALYVSLMIKLGERGQNSLNNIRDVISKKRQ